VPLATLTATGISKSFGGHAVLDAVDLVVAPGDRIGVVAPNGTGKTTLLRILAGEEPPDRGRIALAPPDASVGYLRQEVARSERETGRAHLARVTGVAGAQALLDVAAQALAEGRPDAPDAYARALDRYVGLGAGDFEVRVPQVAADVGLPEATLDLATAALSGGQAARLALAAILLARFDVFLLDEPTNDLDFDGLARLEAFLASIPGGAVIVSHDRAFLSRTITAVVELDDHTHRAARYDGGWTAFLEERAVARRHANERYDEYVERRDALRRRSQREREWSHTGAKKVKRSGERDKFVRHFRTTQTEQLAARAKRTERMLERLDAVDKPWEGWELRLELASAGRAGDVVARLDGAVVERGDFRLGPVDVEIGWAERVAITGPNGSGKSTLLGAILGRYRLASGARRVGPSVVFGELDQARGRFEGGRLLGEAFEDASGFTRTESRTLLAKFGLGADHVDRPVATLSAGERTRAALAVLMASGTNCLVLDEPTNHLDLPAIEQLEQALATWEGALLLVTHDEAFLDAVAVDRRIDVDAGHVVESR
jgi:ATPase subunit of ABC transporter with duplicated ATPase domains